MKTRKMQDRFACSIVSLAVSPLACWIEKMSGQILNKPEKLKRLNKPEEEA